MPPPLDFGLVHNMIVIKHQLQVNRQSTELVDQAGQVALRCLLTRAQRRQKVGADAWRRGLQGRDKVRPKCRWIVVGLVEREPGYGGFAERRFGQPFSEQRRLAKTGRCRDQGQLRAGAALEKFP